MPEAAAHAGDGIIKMLRNNVQAPAIGNDDAGKGGKTPVSYTHLTLPTTSNV